MALKMAYYLNMLKRIRHVGTVPKIWNYCRYRLSAKLPIVPCGLYTPQIIGLLVTKRCNLNCGYCNAAKILHEGKNEWREAEANLEIVRRIFAHPLCSNCLLVDLLGGEPLLVKELDKIVAFLTKRGHLTNTSTNGLLLESRIHELKQAGITRINVSLYEANRSILERDLEKINQVFPVHASIVLLRSQVENAPEKLIETVRFVKKQGCLSLRFWMYRPMGLDPRVEEIILDTNPAYQDFHRRIDEEMPGFCLWPIVVKTAHIQKQTSEAASKAGLEKVKRYLDSGHSGISKPNISHVHEGLRDSITVSSQNTLEVSQGNSNIINPYAPVARLRSGDLPPQIDTRQNAAADITNEEHSFSNGFSDDDFRADANFAAKWEAAQQRQSAHDNSSDENSNRRDLYSVTNGSNAVPVVNHCQKKCRQLWQRTSCDMLGNVFACCGIDKPLSGREGNLFQSDIDSIFNHSTIVSMRRQMLDHRSDPPDPCKTCNLLGEAGW